MLYSLLLYILTIAINLLAAFIGFYVGSSKEDIGKKIRRIKKKIIPLIGMVTVWGILMTVFFVGNDYTRTAEKNEDRAEIISNVVTELGVYHLKYDSSQKRIISVIRDSLKVNTTVVNHHPPTPDLDFCPSDGFVITEVTNDTVIIRVKFCNNIATSYHINVGIRGVMKFTNGDILMIGDVPLIQREKIPINESIEQSVTIRWSGDRVVEKLYLLGIGTYKNAGNKSRKVNTLLVHNFGTNETGYPTGIDPDLDSVKTMLGAGVQKQK